MRAAPTPSLPISVASLASLVLAPALLLAACASDPAPGTPDPKVVCTSEAPTGSNIKVRRCWTEEQSALQQQDTRAIESFVARGGKTPVLPAADFHAMGFKIVLYSAPALFLAMHGIGLLTLLVAGIGYVHKMNMPWQNWITAKIACWVLLAAAPILVRKGVLPRFAGIVMVLALGATAVWLAQSKPF